MLDFSLYRQGILRNSILKEKGKEDMLTSNPKPSASNSSPPKKGAALSQHPLFHRFDLMGYMGHEADRMLSDTGI